MAQDCQTCTELRVRLMNVLGEVQSTAALITAEFEKPTMPKTRLTRVVEARLYAIFEGVGM
jgi:hypothetical protein